MVTFTMYFENGETEITVDHAPVAVEVNPFSATDARSGQYMIVTIGEHPGDYLVIRGSVEDVHAIVGTIYSVTESLVDSPK